MAVSRAITWKHCTVKCETLRNIVEDFQHKFCGVLHLVPCHLPAHMGGFTVPTVICYDLGWVPKSISKATIGNVPTMRISLAILTPLQLITAEGDRADGNVTSCLSVGMRYEKFASQVCEVKPLNKTNLDLLLQCSEGSRAQQMYAPHRHSIRI